MSRHTVSPVARHLHSYGANILAKAKKLLANDDAIVHPDRKRSNRWIVYPDGMGGRKYTVAVVVNEEEGWVMALCSCPNGNAKGEQGRCYHKAAALAKMWGEEL